MCHVSGRLGEKAPSRWPGEHLRWDITICLPIVLLGMGSESGEPENNSHLCCAFSGKLLNLSPLHTMMTVSLSRLK